LLPDLTTRTLVLILIETGLRAIDAHPAAGLSRPGFDGDLDGKRRSASARQPVRRTKGHVIVAIVRVIAIHGSSRFSLDASAPTVAPLTPAPDDR
jgi:hypothetical protein